MTHYICNFCGKSYDNMDDYMNCVQKCGTEQKKRMKIEAEKKERLNKERDVRLAEVKEAEENYKTLRTKFIKDYGSYSSDKICTNISDVGIWDTLLSLFD